MVFGRIFSLCVACAAVVLAGVAVAADQNRMPISAESHEAIQKNTEMARSSFSKLAEVEFDYSKESIAWVDGFINRNRHAKSQGMVDIIGSYLGSAIVKNFGGRWISIDGRVAVELEEDVVVFPFSKVEKQLTNGAEDSILSFYEVIPVLVADQKAKRASNKTMEPTR